MITENLARLDIDETEADELRDAKSLVGKLEYHQRKANVLRQKLAWKQRRAQARATSQINAQLQAKLDAAGITVDDPANADPVGLNAVLDADMTPAEKKAIVKAGLATREMKRTLEL